MQLAIAPESLAELQTHHTDYSPADYPHAEHHSLEMGS